MKVLHLLQSNRFSGAENVACQIIDMLRGEADMEQAYCSPDGSVRIQVEDKGIGFYPLAKLTVKEVRRVISKYRPDIIHAHDARAGVIAAVSCGKIPLVVHMHGNSYGAQRFTLKSVLMRIAAKKARHIFWVSTSAFEGYYFHKSFAHKGSVLSNVLDPKHVRERAASALRQEAYDVVYVGRLDYPKDPERVTRLLCDVVKTDCSLTTAIVGMGSAYDDVKANIEKRGLAERVRLLGYIDNPLGIVRNAKVMVMASRWEGMPISALEATCLGVPLVSTPTDGLRELIIDGKNGYLSNDDEILVGKCIEITRNTALRANLSEQAKTRANELMDVDTYRKQVLSIYRQCVKSSNLK